MCSTRSAAAKEGRVTETGPKKLKLGRTGLGGGQGASVFWYKHRVENRRSRAFILSGADLIFVIASIGFGFFMRGEGIVPALIALKESGCGLFVATSKPEKFAVKIIRHFGLERYFLGICGATDALSGNSKSEVIKSALERYKITDKPEILMVGDRRHDIEGAKANGIKAAGVLYGYGDMSELTEAGADFLVKTPFDLAPRILAAE